MIDIHNEARVDWCYVNDDTKTEIDRQEILGAVVNAYDGYSNSWAKVMTHIKREHRHHNAYRIQPGTEVPPAAKGTRSRRNKKVLGSNRGFSHSATE